MHGELVSVVNADLCRQFKAQHLLDKTSLQDSQRHRFGCWRLRVNFRGGNFSEARRVKDPVSHVSGVRVRVEMRLT